MTVESRSALDRGSPRSPALRQFLDQLARTQAQSPGEPRAPRRPAGDHALDPAVVLDIGKMNAARPAAVLIPIVDRTLAPTVLLTVRSPWLRAHAGQVAFPGGTVDATDPSPTATALREAREEIGLDAAHARPVGHLPAYYTRTGYAITPVLAVVTPDFVPAPDPREVRETFEVPLFYLMDVANHRTHETQYRGKTRRYFAMTYGRHYIWGATAGILRCLYEEVIEP